MTSYEIITLWPNHPNFKVGDILTIYPSGNEDEKRYGCKVGDSWQWVSEPWLYEGKFKNILQ